MSSSDQAKTQPVVRPSEGPSQACGPAGLEDALQRIAGQIGDADRRHRNALADMQERLGQLGRQVGQVRAELPEQHAAALGRLELEIAGLTERIAAFGRERQAQKGMSGAGRPRVMAGDTDEPWDAQSAEALTRVYEMAQAEESDRRRSRRAPASNKPLRSARAVPAQPQAPAPAPASVPAYDQAWLEARFAGIAALLQQSLADSNPAKPLAAVDRRLDRLEGRLDCLFNDMSVRLGGPWLELIEEHIKGLAGHFEATSRQLARLDAVDEQLRQLSRALEEHVQWSRAQPAGLRDDAIAAMIDTAAERAAGRLAATSLAAATPAPEAEDSKRIDTLETLLQDYIGERRRGEEAASSMLQTIEATLIRILDRVDAMEAAGATSYVPTDGNAPGQDGMDAESDRLAEAYASGARILGQKPSQPMLDAADYAPLLAGQEKKPELAAGGLDDATAEAIQTRHEPSAFAMRAKLKAEAAPEAPTAASPAAGDTKADTDKREHAKTSARARGSWSSLLLGGAMLLLFGIGYLAVDLFVAPGAMPARQQNSVAPTVEGQPATDPTQLKAEQGTPDPQPGPQTGKSEVVPPSPEDKEEPLQVPVPQPAQRPARETLTDDLGQAEPLRQLAAVSTQSLPGTVLQDIPLAANDGAAPPGIDAMPPPGVGTAALRNAAANGDALAQLEVAARFAEGNGVARDHKLAFAWYERAAMHGLAAAQFRLAAYYERGVGVGVDAERAKIWYRRAAEQGHVRAMHNLAVLVVGNGKDDADYAAAARWFQQAADRGLTDSQFNLAVLYAHGRGVAKDSAEAYKWFALAARSGDAGAGRKLEEMKAQLDMPEREAAEQKIAAWRAKPVEPAANFAGR
jgi:localization factor PodJL